MPELGPKNILEAYDALDGRRDHLGKVVRQGPLVWWGTDDDVHIVMKNEADISSPDDHGFIATDYLNGVRYMVVFGRSSTLTYRGFPYNEEERRVTAEIIKGFASTAGVQIEVSHKS